MKVRSKRSLKQLTSYDDCFSCKVNFSLVEKGYTTTKRNLRITEQVVAVKGAVLSSCSSDVGPFLPRLHTSLADRKSKEVKSKVHFTLNTQCSFPDESAINRLFCTQDSLCRKKNTINFYVCHRVCCSFVVAILTTVWYLVVATNGKKILVRWREERSSV